MTTTRQSKSANIVFVITDDQGYGDLGCHGNPIIQTPNINKFHKQSTRFTQYHVGTTCAPTRSGLLTGLNCNSAGVWHTIGGASLLRHDVRTLPQVLMQHGYSTGMFGKWHLGDEYPYRPNDRGFEHAVYHKGGGITQISDHWGNNYMNDTYLVNGKPKDFKGYCTDVFFDETMDFIRRHVSDSDADGKEEEEEHEKKPFFAYLATNAPHHPYNVEAKYRDLYKDECIPEDRKRFYGMITNIDENFARLRSLLHELHIEDDTILVFTTDNGTSGGVTQDENQFIVSGHNGGMRGQKASPYEGGHRVPFFIRYPNGNIAEGKDLTVLSSYTDVMPTLLHYCGIASSLPNMEGKNLHPMLDSTTTTSPNHEKDTVKEFEQRALVVDTQRVAHPIKWRLSCVMKQQYRLISGRHLFNINTDPEQRVDVSNNHPQIVSELRDEYETWWTLCSRQMENPDNSTAAIIGSDQTRNVKLTTMDLRNDDSDVVWHQGQVRKGQVCLGWWDIDVKSTSTYRISARRWPEETNYSITDGIIQGTDDDVDLGPKDLIDPSSLWCYQGGKAIDDVYGAAIKIDMADNYYVDLEHNAKEAIFQIHLKEGCHTLRAWFTGGVDVRNATVMCPYYITITKLEEEEDHDQHNNMTDW
eukprot:CAMPEP_0195508114 /NCGR_PEP_ID=MMETSP0794_2-20130614/1409_1 /TAXON_ID=515487 /ORGANISM="Stephanopyxis turris, Strain CCMP 815" /LENGTH=640 /DNA_ID=CAMNT_0040634993 /DNA_START=76 /DNA_END=1995 /DNA_ORIENTATION=+